MKKIVPLILALCVLLSVSACKKDALTPSAPDQIPAQDPEAATDAFVPESGPEAVEPAAVYHVGDTVSATYFDFTLEKVVFCEALSEETYNPEGNTFTAFTLPAAYDPNANQQVAPLNHKFAYIEFSLHNKDRIYHIAFDSNGGILDDFHIGVNYTGVPGTSSYLKVLAASTGEKWESFIGGMEPDQTMRVKGFVPLNNPIEDTGTPIDLVFAIREPIDYGEVFHYTFALNY